MTALNYDVLAELLSDTAKSFASPKINNGTISQTNQKIMNCSWLPDQPAIRRPFDSSARWKTKQDMPQANILSYALDDLSIVKSSARAADSQ